MVKLSWLEESAIYIIVAGVMIFFIRLMQNLIDFDYWVWVVIWLILYLGITNILIKLIRGKDEEEPKQNKTFENWWKKQKTYEKILIIILFVIIVFSIWAYLSGY